ncbi:SIR2 family protein, partial [Escherichia coli]|uniref:SIR2 family protein n=1 Tax=Escherichia coli TaxID=562 RepID=UPI00266596E8
GKNSLNRLIRCVCGKKIGPDPRNFNQRVSLGRNDLLIRTFPKTFLFIGFSFTDPNLDYILSRLHVPEKHRRRHYCFLRKEPSLPQGNEDEAGAMYRQRRQEHHIRDLLRFGIQAVLVNEYDDIPLILKEIESRFLKKTIFISVKWFTEFGHLNRGDMLTSEQHRCHNEKKKFQRRV